METRDYHVGGMEGLLLEVKMSVPFLEPHPS